MQKNIHLTLTPKQATQESEYKNYITEYLKIKPDHISYFKILKKSIDARSHQVKIVVELSVLIDEEVPKPEEFKPNYDNVANQPEIIIVGSGPAGLFAGLKAIELGYRPVILERGKEIQQRRRDIALLSKKHMVNPDSNYCFGEGGAGTFSDGKLYTRSKKRGSVKRILELLKYFGADEKILVEAHPHIGTNKLPAIIKNIRQTILDAGGEIRFNTKLIDFIIKDDKIQSIKTNKGDQIDVRAVILATGHSARDIYYLLAKKGVELEEKSFAMGVRVEHPQELIDSIQYHCDIRNEYLPAASYSLVNQVNGRGVYSFCMCPGGIIVPSATEADQVVVNGMSSSSRNSKFANSGMVVEIRSEDTAAYKEYGKLAGLKFQEQLEKMAFLNGGSGQTAPAQRLHDFVNNKLSANLPETSYHPGIGSSPLHFWLPEHLGPRLQMGFKTFGKKMYGYLTNEAVVLGVESRTSSPLRIPRDKEKFHHPRIKNLFPCGEGAGFSGGIVSSAVDGELCAERATYSIKK